VIQDTSKPWEWALAAALVWALTGEAEAGVYRCGTTYTDRPCAVGQAPLNLPDNTADFSHERANAHRFIAQGPYLMVIPYTASPRTLERATPGWSSLDVLTRVGSPDAASTYVQGRGRARERVDTYYYAPREGSLSQTVTLRNGVVTGTQFGR